jgi:hypothetical protein
MFNNGVKKMKKENAIKNRFFSVLLATTLISGAAVTAPASHGADMPLSEMNSVQYTLTNTVNTLVVDLADKYFYQFAYVDVKKKVLVNGKMVLRYVNVDIVVLDEFARATIKTRIGISIGDIIRVSMAENPDNIIVKWQHIK